jgi:hypothetical protein
MVKTRQNLELFGPDWRQVLSILESRKTTRLSLIRSAEDYNLDLLQNGRACAVKQAVVKRGLRKSSSLTNGMGELETKAHLESMAKKARGLLSRILPTIVNAPILGNSGE